MGKMILILEEQMGNGFKDRFYKRQKWTLNCEVVTPMFLGNANQQAEWRAEPFKSLLRYWWRVAQRSRQSDWQDLLKDESGLFGSAGDDDGKGGKSGVVVRIVSDATPIWDLPKESAEIPHPEAMNVGAMGYLAGQGIIRNGKSKTNFFTENSSFTLFVDSPLSESENISAVLSLIQSFGAIGARSRNGWGSFRVINGGCDKQTVIETLKSSTVNDWKTGFKKDYPNCLGADSKGPLLWKTVQNKGQWREVMKDLATAYIELRAGKIKNDPNKLHPDKERPLLGTPITNHFSNDRYSSPIRLVIRKTESDYRGFILHLPQEFPNNASHLAKAMGSREKQLFTWTDKIHKRLDNMTDKLRRASYEECL